MFPNLCLAKLRIQYQLARHVYPICFGRYSAGVGLVLFGRLIRSVDGIYILFNAVTNAAPWTAPLYICHNFSMSRLIRTKRQSALLLGKSMVWHDIQIN